ncbi:hypothetical protein M758_12G174700 [Ceratodon purpureus]|nr:hypothetical protein M758_12G174700 [Ceratodon purpureus]
MGRYVPSVLHAPVCGSFFFPSSLLNGCFRGLFCSSLRVPYEYWFEVAVDREVYMWDEFAALNLSGLGRGAVK